MNLDKIIQCAAGVVIAAYLAGRLPQFTSWVHLQTAKLLYSSRTSTWGSPKFFPETEFKITKNHNKPKEVRSMKKKANKIELIGKNTYIKRGVDE